MRHKTVSDSQAQLALGDAPALPVPAPDAQNRFLLAYRGHGRHWSELQLLAWLQAIAEGHSISASCSLSGLPRPTAYNLMAREPELAQAVRQVYAQEGSDAWEDRLHGVAFGDVDPKVVPALVAGLKLRGKLQVQHQAPVVPLALTLLVGTAPPARCQCPAPCTLHTPAPVRTYEPAQDHGHPSTQAQG